MFILTEEGKEKQRLIKAGLDKDSVAVYWTIYCPGKGTCKRVCGGIGTCDEGCISQRKRHDRHNCQVSVTAKIMLSDETSGISGQWTAVHHLAVNELRNSGQLLLYQKGNAEEAAMDDIDKEDGAALMTAITQHKDGFGCPTSFTIMSRENSDNIFNALRAIKENVPCPDDECDHPFRYFELPNNQGYRRVTQCSRVQEYKPLVMIDKFEASANACQRLELTYVLCWFHLVKAVMEKLTHESVSLHDSYLIILGFKIVARAVSEERACERWQMFLQVIDLLFKDDKQIRLKKYFIEEWWCPKWRYAWLDITRRPLACNGSRTMTTNNCDENLNLKVANCVGGKRKKVSILVFELTGFEKAKSGNEAAVGQKKKASLLDTHAAKTICHNLGTRKATPSDITLRDNQARFMYLTYKVKDTEKKMGFILLQMSTKRFKETGTKGRYQGKQNNRLRAGCRTWKCWSRKRRYAQLPATRGLSGEDSTDDKCLGVMRKVLEKGHHIHRHCFLGNIDMYRKWKSYFPNCKFGIYPFLLMEEKYPDIRSTVCNMDINDNIIETDAPYQVTKEEEQDVPSATYEIAKKLANLFNVSLMEVASVTTSNALKLYNIKH
ncbi:TatD DNase family protein [Mytilus galloprovincialis]|uniref:TatD DNase family protein n=1 Tax=Mytilus galloprovincialis TaxID=29158 RepID=A0A8B6FIB7_MYTGA|nr:TatD DNase family protein [Mytilus galloprovincialis]